MRGPVCGPSMRGPQLMLMLMLKRHLHPHSDAIMCVQAMEDIEKEELEMLLEAYLLEVSGVCESMDRYRENIGAMEATMGSNQVSM